MKTTELIKRLQDSLAINGDLEVLVSGYEMGWDRPDDETPQARSLYQGPFSVCGEFDDVPYPTKEQEPKTYLCIER